MPFFFELDNGPLVQKEKKDKPPYGGCNGFTPRGLAMLTVVAPPLLLPLAPLTHHSPKPDSFAPIVLGGGGNVAHAACATKATAPTGPRGAGSHPPPRRC